MKTNVLLGCSGATSMAERRTSGSEQTLTSRRYRSRSRYMMSLLAERSGEKIDQPALVLVGQLEDTVHMVDALRHPNGEVGVRLLAKIGQLAGLIHADARVARSM